MTTTPPASSPGPSAAPRPPARRARGGGNWRSLVLSMAIVLAVVVGWLSLMPRPARIDRPTVDVTASAAYVLDSTGTAVLLPTLDAPWRPTSVRQTDTAALPGWHAGWTRPDDDTGYIGLEQARSRDETSDAAWTREQVGAARPTGSVEVGGRAWRTFATDADPVRTSLVGTVDGMLVVVTGLADQQTLAAVASSLRPFTPAPTPSS